MKQNKFTQTKMKKLFTIPPTPQGGDAHIYLMTDGYTITEMADTTHFQFVI